MMRMLFGESVNYQFNCEEKTRLKLQLYPNPSSDYIHISGFKSAISSIKVYNQQGQLQFESKQTLLDIRSLIEGIYFIDVTLQNGQRAIQKVYKK
jgi:hypothetical protein